jgi:hypothetical protein
MPAALPLPVLAEGLEGVLVAVAHEIGHLLGEGPRAEDDQLALAGAFQGSAHGDRGVVESRGFEPTATWFWRNAPRWSPWSV